VFIVEGNVPGVRSSISSTDVCRTVWEHWTVQLVCTWVCTVTDRLYATHFLSHINKEWSEGLAGAARIEALSVELCLRPLLLRRWLSYQSIYRCHQSIVFVVDHDFYCLAYFLGSLRFQDCSASLQPDRSNPSLKRFRSAIAKILTLKDWSQVK